MLRSAHAIQNPTSGLTSFTPCVYVMWSPTRSQFKIGEGDVGKRLASHRTACPDIELVAAVQKESASAIEGTLHAHFAEERVGESEWFTPSQRLSEWVDRFRSRPNVARTIGTVQQSYSTPDLWPWASPEPFMDIDGQLGLEMFANYFPARGSGNGQTSAISEDWYTPARYIEAVRELFGGRIDLDPASCAEANLTVRAEDIYTAEVDGLRRRWHGNVYLNPPWGRAGHTKMAFVRKTLHAYETGDITGAVLALNSNATTSAWFHPLFRFPICFPNHRVAHTGPGGCGGAPNSGTVFVYLGPEQKRFNEIFSEFGSVLPPAWRRLRDDQALAEDYEDEDAA